MLRLRSLAAACPYCGSRLPMAADSPRELKDWLGAIIVSWLLRFIPPLHATRLIRLYELVADSPQELVVFFEQNVGLVRRVFNGDSHKKVCEAALAKLQAFSLSDPELARTVPQLQARLDAASTVNDRKGLRLLIFLFAIAVLFFGTMGYLGFWAATREARARDAVQSLIREGKFDEARIRAKELGGGKNQEAVMKAIEEAEKKKK